MRFCLLPKRASWALRALVVLAALALPAGALGAPTPQRSHPPVTAIGTLAQLRSPDGKDVYVAASTSNAIAVFKRDASTGELTQGAGTAGCIAARGASGCAQALGLGGPNSVAVSADGKNVYATSLESNALDIFRRNPATGALSQATGGNGCIANVATSGCALGRALAGPDIVTVSPDGHSVYATAFASGAIGVFNRASQSGALIQKPRRPGCLTTGFTPDCTPARTLLGVSSAVVSPDGRYLYAAAFASSALGVFKRASGPAPHPG
jgi:DNA-binding beta-propeller fold protein YncE